MWHDKSLEKIFARFETDKQSGLSLIEARKRLEEYGPNILPKGKKTGWWKFLLRQFKSPLVYILVIGALLTAFLKVWVDMSVILLAIFVNVSVGFWQEFRSSNILEKLRAIVEINALVIRGGEMHEIDAAELVPGDVILLKPGKKVPADARIIESRHLETDESLLTGESSSVSKKSSMIEERDVALGDRFNMVHMGTVITRGEGRAVVVATGRETEIGKIALLTEQAEDEPTPLQLRIGKLGQIIAVLVGVASLVIFVVGILEKHEFQEMLTTAIAVAVAAIPEGLPAAISIVLAVSAQRILKRKGVVKQLVAAETLGSASVICADKTGTLTEGIMKVKKLLVEGNEVHAREILALANEALIEKTKDGGLVRGETTDQAKMRAFLDAEGNYEDLIQKFPRIDLLQFHPSRKYIASLHQQTGNKLQDISYQLFLTGAPEILVDLSGHILTSSGSTELLKEKREELESTYKKLAGEGYRIIALAERDLSTSDINHNHNHNHNKGVDLEDEETRNQLIRDLTFVGFAAIRDPIREDVRESIRVAKKAGVRPIMLTGDHVLTARAIGEDLGFRVTPEAVMEGTQIDTISDIDLEQRLRTVEIFARVNPEHKMRIVDILQKQGEVVAMTGDGVNDAPALKSADIGVALESGTDVAKEASDLILLNNSFTVIVSAIKQGRIAFDNIRKVTVFLLVQSFTELILILAALVFRTEILPISAVMILWTNLIEDSFPNIALSFEPGEKDIMDRKPLKKDEPILDRTSKVIVFAVGLLTDILLLGLFFWLYNQFYLEGLLSAEYVQTFIFAALGLDSFFYIYSIKSLHKPLFSYNLFNNPYLVGATILGIGAMLAAIYIPFFNMFLGTAPLIASHWIIIIALGIFKIIGVELTKWWFVRRK